ncbi:MAG: hypothetical protein WC758_02195 [Candidatus Woesearchaeota archaeon]|jgi:2-iminoacetate synthase
MITTKQVQVPSLIAKLEKFKEKLNDAPANINDIARSHHLDSLFMHSLNGELNLESLAIVLKNINSEKLIAKAINLNKELYKKKIEFYGVSYIADLCVNDCTYCGHSSRSVHEREMLDSINIRRDFSEILKYKPSEICILAGEHKFISPEYLANAANIALDIDGGKSLERISFNVAPMQEFDFKKLIDGVKKSEQTILQFRVFQESYDEKIYAINHTRGPKRDFEFRLNSQQRALNAGFNQVGIGTLLGLNNEITNELVGSDFEIGALIVHAYHLFETTGSFPATLSIPRLQAVVGSNFEVPSPVDDERYIEYHSILRMALPQTKLIITGRETPVMLDKLRPLINIEDLSTKPGVGGNYRDAVHFQNMLGTTCSSEQRIRTVLNQGYFVDGY